MESVSRTVRSEPRNTLVLFVGTAISASFGLTFSLFAARVLGPSDYADFATAVVIFLMCRTALSPIHGAVTNFSARYLSHGKARKVYNLYYSLSKRVAFVGLGALLVVGIGINPISVALRFQSVLPLVLAALITFVGILVSIPRGVLRGGQRFLGLASNHVVESFLRLILGVIFLMVASTPASGLTAYLVALIAALLLAHSQAQSIWPGCTVPAEVEHRGFRSFASSMLILTSVSAVFQTTDLFVAKVYMNSTDAGLYGAAFTLAGSLGVLATPVAMLLLPLVAITHEQSGNLGRPLIRLVSYFVLAAVLPLTLFWMFPEKIISVLFGQAYMNAATFLDKLALAHMAGHLSHMIALTGITIGEFRPVLVVSGGMLVQLLVLLNWHNSVEALANIAATVRFLTLMGTVIAIFYVLGYRTSRGSSC